MLSILRKTKIDEATPISQDVSGLLMEMLKYGKPRLGVYSSNGLYWSCSVEMNTNTPGSVFDIKSEFNVHTKPYDAAKECYERILNTMKVLGK